MIFEALKSGLFRFKFDLLSSKILKIPEFNLQIFHYSKAKQKFSELENNLELEKYCNEEVPIIKTQNSIPDTKPIRLPNRPSSGTELEIYTWPLFLV